MNKSAGVQQIVVVIYITRNHMMFKMSQKLKSYLLYGVVFSLVVTVSSFVNRLFESKSLPTVSKGVQLSSTIPYASADHPPAEDTNDDDDCDP